MRLTALKDLPNGVPAGQTFEENAIMGGVLLLAGVVREEVDTAPLPILPRVKRAYRRRDLRAED